MQYFSTIVVGIMTAFALVGIIDQLFLKNRLGLGAEFQRGIEMIGPLCLAIVGIIALVPEMKWGIEHTLTPLYRTLGLDPSMAVTSILAIDMGGYQLAESVAIDPLIGQWAGIVYGSMMGATIVFTIPVGLAAIGKQDVAAFSKGVLYGIAAIPIGTFVGGLVMGIPVGYELREYLRLNASRPLTVAEVAAHFGYSCDHLSRLYRREFGCDLKRGIVGARLRHIEALLLNTDYPLKTIAHMCGFGDENALVKFFGYHEGISPTSYRSRFFRVHRNAH